MLRNGRGAKEEDQRSNDGKYSLNLDKNENKKLEDMCRYNLSFSIDDQVVDVVRPEVGSDKALEAWMIRVLKKSMADFARELKAQTARKADGEALLSRLKALPNTPEGFLQLGGILGEARKDFSWEELREEAYAEKYGI